MVLVGNVGPSKSGMIATLFSGLAAVLLKLIPDSKRVPLSPSMVKYPYTHNEWYRETLTELLDSLAAGRIKPVVAERMPLAEAARAHELLERGGYAGKVVLVTGA